MIINDHTPHDATVNVAGATYFLILPRFDIPMDNAAACYRKHIARYGVMAAEGSQDAAAAFYREHFQRYIIAWQPDNGDPFHDYEAPATLAAIAAQIIEIMRFRLLLEA